MQRYRPTFEQIWQAFSGEAAWQAVVDLSRFHRIQASPGYRQAAHWLCDRLLQDGLQAEVLSFPADARTHFWTWSSFQEWDCSGATLDLVEPADGAGRLADFRACPISLIQRSAPFDGELAVTLLDDGEEDTDYAGLDVAGKVVLTRGDVRRVYELAVKERGAAGLLFDGMRAVPPVRPEGDLADVRQYTGFWWRPGDVPCFGFVLTRRQGEMLRRLLKEGSAPVRVHASVASRLYDGAFEVVTATIPGENDQEVIVVAHLCHPRPSANDNASGAAAALEAARTLQHLVARGGLARPRRTIRFLWVPEMTGTAAYLSAHQAELDRLVAGVNLDMVGENQAQTGSSWLIERPPDAAASFAPELLGGLRSLMLTVKGMDDVSPSHTGLGTYPLYRLAETPFSGGSDHYILSDPTVGVPTPTLIQWPDRFYHTSADTPDRTDPHSLARSGALAAAYAYWVASAGRDEAVELGYDMAARFRAELVGAARRAVSEAFACADDEALARVVTLLDRRLAYRLDRQKAALWSLQRLAPLECLIAGLEDDLERAAQQELARARDAIALHAATPDLDSLPNLLPQDRSEREEEAAAFVPLRTGRGPTPLSDHLHRLDAGEREKWRQLLKARQGRDYWTLTSLALYWADGTRSVLEIADLIEMETGEHDLELILAYFRVLERLDLVSQ